MNAVHLTCKVAALNEGLDTEYFQTAGFAMQLRDHFLRASGDVIDLDVQWSPIEPILAAGQAAREGDLHFGMRSLTSNPSRPPIDTIGLLLAASHRDDANMFGLMFDQGIAAMADDWYAAVPREGAAVFLDTIKRERDTSERLTEYLFTAVHEMGHVFNLWHAPQDPPTFMSRSALSDTAFGGGAFFFQGSHCEWLSGIAGDRRVQPGETRFIDRDSRNAKDQPSAPGDEELTIQVAIRPAECTRYEPVHLDVTVAVAGSTSRRIRRMVDPAHGAFRIFIEDPSGRTRLYSSSVHCCPTSRQVLITPEKPFRRDIVVTVEQGRYTFNEPGVYRILVEFDCARNVTLRSNDAHVEILSKRDRAFDSVVQALQTPAAARLMQYRRLPNAQEATALAGVIDSWRGQWDERKSLIAYRWALAALDPARITAAASVRQRAVAYLSKCRSLRTHREMRAEELLSGSVRRKGRSPRAGRRVSRRSS